MGETVNKMKAKTIIQKKAVKISASLPTLSAAQFKWAKTLLPSFIYSTKKRKVCLDCGYENKEHFETCPACGAKMSEMNTKARYKKEFEVFQIYTTRQNIQIVRFFCIEKHSKVGGKAFYVADEIAQYFIDSNGEETVLARNYNPFFSYFATTPSAIWNMYSDLNVKKTEAFLACKPWGVDYPRAKFTQFMKKRGFKTGLYIHPIILMQKLMNNDSIAETLLKAGEYELLSFYTYEKCNFTPEIWTAIKICFRQKYKIEDVSLWRDYINFLKAIGKDIRNPKYICPKNLKEAHDWAMCQKKKQNNKNFEYRHKIDQEKYQQRIAKFMDIEIIKDDLKIEVLKTIAEFEKEGEIMKHCVYENNYFDKEDSLILSARIGDRIIETIEVSLSQRKILQHRGFDNSTTDYGQKIEQMIKNQLFPILKKVA
ncbi:MAG: PcfJ domain-containing protein [Bacteroidales bacterium]